MALALWLGPGAQSIPGLRTSVAVAQGAPETGAQGIRLDNGRFTVVAGRRDERLARALMASAVVNDRFPGLRPSSARVLIAVAPDADTFRLWVGPFAPEWGAAIAFPDQQRIIMQGGYASSEAGDPLIVLRHELAHLALHEQLGPRPSRWFDEGYASVAAGEFSREQVFETTLGMVWRTLPSFEALEDGFRGGGMEASWSYAMAHRIVSELRELGGDAGLARFFVEWESTNSFEKALRSSYGMTGEAFEKHWQSQTRRRYGALALVTNVSAVVGLLSLALVPLVVQRRKRDRARLDAMRAADAAQEAALRESSLQALLDMPEGATSDPEAEPESDPEPVAPLPGPSSPRYPPA